jgi:hypothetical protein
MSYGLGLEFSASAGCSGTGCTAYVGSGSGKKPKCGTTTWWRCAELVTYFDETTGAGYSRRHVIVSGSLYQIKVEVVNALLAMHMLSHTYGWANVKSQVRAMAWYLNYQRNWDFDDCIEALESAVAPAYDKYAQDEDKKLAAAAAAPPKITFNFGPEWTACMQGEIARAKLKLPYDTGKCAQYLPGASPLLKINPAFLTLRPPVTTKPTIKLFGMGPGMAPGPGEPITPAPEGEGMSTTTMLLIGAGVLAVGGGLYYVFGRKKAA